MCELPVIKVPKGVEIEIDNSKMYGGTPVIGKSVTVHKRKGMREATQEEKEAMGKHLIDTYCKK